MEDSDYSAEEQAIIDRLPQPRQTAQLRCSNPWVIEWLPDGERQTGRELVDWMNQQRPNWAKYIRCRSKADVIEAIHLAERWAMSTGSVPILHIEAHGDEAGLEGPDLDGIERLTWDELNGPLQSLNVATGCNLVLVVAACTGIAGLIAMAGGPRAAAMGVVGPTDTLSPRDLLEGLKEFYRRLQHPGAHLAEMTDSASRETSGVDIAIEPFAPLIMETIVKDLVLQLRAALAKQAAGLVFLPEAQFTHHQLLQVMWDQMFMIDIHPENRERFDLNLEHVVEVFREHLRNELGRRLSSPPSPTE